MNAVILLEHVSKSFGSFRAVDDLTLSVPAGSVYGFLGPNGAGKTTVIRMILSIFRPTAGRIEVLGRPSALEVRNRIGYLPEEKGLYKDMKAWAIIAYFGMLKGLARADAKRRSHDLLEQYGLGDASQKKCSALSKGMQQKVQLLSAMVHQPDLVILDEPFSGLDPVNQDIMEGVISGIRARGGTVIFSTHVMEHAERLCEKILLIARGRKVFDGTIADAKRMIPRTLRIEAGGGMSKFRRMKGVQRIDRAGTSDAYVLTLSTEAAPEDILRACIKLKVPIRRFDQSEPSLRDVFVKLVGHDGAQESMS